MSYTITEEQIKSIAEGGGKTKIKEMFPQVFGEIIQKGKWYKTKATGSLFFVEKILTDYFIGYGFNSKPEWTNSTKWYEFIDVKMENLHAIPATYEEVESALIAEAKKRGFVAGAKYLSPNGGFKRTVVYPLVLTDDGKDLKCANHELLTLNGKWAEIIKETPEDFINDIFNKDLTCKTDKDKYPNSVFYFQGEKSLLEIEKNARKVICLA